MLSNSPGHAGERRQFQATTTTHMTDRERCAIPSTDFAAVKGWSFRMHGSYHAPDDGNISTLVDTLSNDFLSYLDMNRVAFPFLFQAAICATATHPRKLEGSTATYTL